MGVQSHRFWDDVAVHSVTPASVLTPTQVQERQPESCRDREDFLVRALVCVDKCEAEDA